MNTTPTNPITVISFGYLHDAPPTADVTLDLRDYLSDPAHVPGGRMLDMRGDEDQEVRDFVFATPGALELLDDTARLASRMAQVKPVVVAFGCKGGKHRAAALAAALGEQLAAAGCDVEMVEHLHAHLPRVIRGEVAS